MVWKENSLGHILEKWGVFSDFVTQYFVDIFSESPTSFFSRINSVIAQFSTKRHKNNRPSVSFYKYYCIKGQLSWSSFMEFKSFFGFCNVFFASTLWFMKFWRFGGKGWLTDWMNESVNDEGVYRTAPATSGLLIT